MDNEESPAAIKNFDIEELNKCTLCSYKSHVKSSFRNHLLRRHGLILTHEPYPKKVHETELLKNCPNCDQVCSGQKKLSEHLKLCKPATYEDDNKKGASASHLLDTIVCLLCSFKSKHENFIVSHYLDEHNLFCKIENDPDFDQVLNSAPYTLQRPVEVDTLPLPDNSDSPMESFDNSKNKEEFFCPTCKKEFLREAYLNIHVKKSGHQN